VQLTLRGERQGGAQAPWADAFNDVAGPDDPTWTIHTEVFDGPLDLLLYLVRRDGIDLLHLPVRHIADSYLAYLDRLRALNLSVAADYLVMAATLVHLKSLELLPRPPTPVDEDEVDPREALAARLRDHAKLAARADALESRPQVGHDIWVRPAPEGEEDRPLASADAFALLDAYYHLLVRRDAPPAKVELSHNGPDLGACVRRLLDALGGPGGRGELGAILRSLPTRADRVVTFLATLEMARLGWIEVRQAGHLAPVNLTRRVDDDAVDLALVVGFTEDPADEDQMALPLEPR
jgi:segregation and condensation protein A